MDFIQFIGTQRSGSNLLRLMLNQHPSISAPHPPHLLKTFMPIIARYGDLKKEDARRELVADMTRWVQANPVPWGLNFDLDQMVKGTLDVYEILREIYHAKMEQDRAQIACCKSMANLSYIEEIERRFRPFYIYIYRDGRDVAASFQRAIIGDKHVYPLAKKWNEQQQLSTAFLENIDERRYHVVAYEELVHEPEKVLKEITAKLGLSFDEGMLTYYQSQESKTTASSGRMWGNVTKPVMAGNVGNYKDQLTTNEINIYEQVAGDSLTLLGYPISLNGSPRVPLEVEEFMQSNVERKKLAKQNASVDDIEKRRPQEELWSEITTKFGVAIDNN